MQKVRLIIKGLKYSDNQTGAYVVVLQPEDSPRQLPIIIGGLEAQSIAIALERAMKPPRPLSHDLMKNLMQKFDLNLQEVIIVKLNDGVFYANLICNQGDEVHAIDARPSDAIALAVRFGCPIYATEQVIEQASIILEEHSQKPIEVKNADEKLEPVSTKKSAQEVSRVSLEELENMLNEALHNEDYELAARLRDEINKRK